MPDTVAYRKKLAKEGKMGCPRTLNYMLDTKKHVLSAAQRFRQKRTIKCKEFYPNWCRRAKTVGLSHVETYDKKCK